MKARRPFTRSLFGYRRRDVDEAITERDSALQASEEKLSGAQRLVEQRESELRSSRSVLGGRAQRIQELDLVAAKLAERVVERERELRRLREELEKARARSRRRPRMPAGSGAAQQPVPAGAGHEADDSDSSAVTVDNGHAERQTSEVFQGLVEVDVGPLGDFSQLLGFEDAAGTIGAMTEISVKRFARGRATLAMRLKHPVELLRELEERAPFDFQVRDVRSDRLILDLPRS
jgi:hypothetical protein